MTIKALFLILFIVTAVSAQDSQERQKEPATKVEQFQAKRGSVIILGFSPIGKLEDQYGNMTSIEVREFTDAATGTKEYGVLVEIKETGRVERVQSSFVDTDELDSLIKGIEYIGRLDKSVTKLKDFQADYKTRGDFTVSSYSTSKGDVAASIKCGSYARASAYYTLPDLVKIRDLLITAQKLIVETKGP